jgi:peptidoglycan/LPS O-acetylase OafA/YrhL
MKTATAEEFQRLEEAQGTRKIAYRPEIDGLRALAVIPVILFHFGVKIVRR